MARCIRVKRSKNFPCTYGINILPNNAYCAFYKVLTTGRHLAIISTNPNNVHGAYEVTIVDEQKLPLWKADMQMRMGRIPRPVESTRVLRVEEISVEMALNYRFEIYETTR